MSYVCGVGFQYSNLPIIVVCIVVRGLIFLFFLSLIFLFAVARRLFRSVAI